MCGKMFYELNQGVSLAKRSSPPPKKNLVQADSFLTYFMEQWHKQFCSLHAKKMYKERDIYSEVQ